MKRVLCVLFPDWPLQRVRAAQPEHKQRPLVLFADCGPDGLRVTLCSRAAAGRGVRPGMRLAEADGLCGSARSRRGGRPRFVRHAAHDDIHALRELADCCQQFTPIVGLEGTDSLVLDVTGCAHLFGGEAGLVERVRSSLSERGLQARVAIADTIGAAWGVAAFPSQQSADGIVPPGRQQEQLAALPVAALRLSEPPLEKLRALGIDRIGQLLELPRASLPSRLGPEVVERLDQALGHAPELIQPVRIAPPVAAAITLPHPTADRAPLECVLQNLIDDILAQLAPRHAGIQQLEIRLQYAPAGETTLRVGAVQPSACREHLTELVLTRLEQTALTGEVQSLQLTVLSSASLDARQQQLFEQSDRAVQAREFLRLVDRLSNRLGKQRVLRPQLRPDVLPEHALHWQPLLDSAPPLSVTLSPVASATSRPLRLLPEPLAVHVVSVIPQGPPLRFEHRGRTYVVRHAWGPERLASGWWRGRMVQRDYYRTETEHGQRFWLFRRITEGDWYLHGEFD